jgi:hypothetical protein
MLADVVPVVHQLAPGLLTSSHPSVAWIRTTRAKYLVFDADATRPVCVVEFGDAERLRRVHAILLELHRRCPGDVPRPLASAPWVAGTAVHIQEGLPGVPWFRLADSLPSADAWRSLLDRAVAVMQRLDAAIIAVPAWVGTVDVREALAEQVRVSRRHGALAPLLLLQVEKCGDRLRSLAPLPAVWQHGDFSLNNLMVSPDSIAVIDFDDFGLTQVPLHDAFGLALSFQLSQDGQCPIGAAECVERCLAATTSFGRLDDGTVHGLLLHHLLWRINQCHGHPTRERLRAWLTAAVQRVVWAPGNGLSAIA